MDKVAQARELVDLKICVSLGEARRICAYPGGYEKVKQIAERLAKERKDCLRSSVG